MRLPVSLHFVTVVVCAAALVSPARTAVLGVRAIHDPVIRTDLELDNQLTPERISLEIDSAIRGGDLDLADSFSELARERGLPLRQEQRDRVEAMRADTFGRAVRDFSDGFTRNDTRSGMAMSGAIAADVSGFGDLRDLAHEGGKWLGGQEADALVLGLAAAGLAITAATWSSLGATFPVRGGLSLTKALQKSGRLSKPLAGELTRVAGAAIDRDALKASLTAASRFEFGAARSAGAGLLRPAAMTELRQLGGDVATVYRRAGARGAQDVLSVAGSGSEVSTAARIAVAKGTKTRAILKVLGRGVLLAGSLSLTLASWLLTFIGFFFALASFARRLGASIGRLLWKVVDMRRKPGRAGNVATSSAC
ncbi:MAG: hypothetical protein JWO64_2691 [Hyphomicrobiales bacterium]|jgi:hypothetical protein|nr:hypothetical protein [Hyphomicrobiales bacterium]